MTDIKELTARYGEIKKLYDISEAETHCMAEMAMMIKMLGHSPKLTLKLLRALTATWEMIGDAERKV